MDKTRMELLQMLRRRGNMLKFIRQGHQAQMHKLDDYMMWEMMCDINNRMSRNSIITMLQDMSVLGWVNFQTGWDDENERAILSDIVLTAAGLTLVIRKQNTAEVLFD
jgi:hypothetical protein